MLLKPNKPPTPRDGTYFGDRDQPSLLIPVVLLVVISAVALVVCALQTDGDDKKSAPVGNSRADR